MIAVSNSTPLIALSRIGWLELLKHLYSDIVIPQAVYDEVVMAGDRSGAEAVKNANWIKVRATSNTTAIALLMERLDQGESEAIALAIETQANLLIIDEARGRRIAQSRGLIHTGTVGTIVLAKRRGLIRSATTLLDALAANEFRMGSALYKQAKALAGE